MFLFTDSNDFQKYHATFINEHIIRNKPGSNRVEGKRRKKKLANTQKKMAKEPAIFPQKPDYAFDINAIVFDFITEFEWSSCMKPTG